jgi:hypothetical protein
MWLSCASLRRCYGCAIYVSTYVRVCVCVRVMPHHPVGRKSVMRGGAVRCAVLSVFCVCLFVFGFVVCRSASPHFGGALTADVGRPSSSADLVVPGQPVKASALWDVVLLGVATDVTTVFAAVAHVLFTNDSGVCSVLAFVTSVCLRWVYTVLFFFCVARTPSQQRSKLVRSAPRVASAVAAGRGEGGGGWGKSAVVPRGAAARACSEDAVAASPVSGGVPCSVASMRSSGASTLPKRLPWCFITVSSVSLFSFYWAFSLCSFCAWPFVVML